jgi:uncharacterized membrane protein
VSGSFLLVRKMTADKVLERLRGADLQGQVLQTSLSNDQEAALRKALSDAATMDAAA